MCPVAGRGGTASVGSRRCMHKTGMPTALRNVSYQGQSGKHVLALSFSGFDPGCVKTCTSQECAELFSLSSSLSGGRKHFWFSNLRNRDGISTRRLNVGVFTRPRPLADLAEPACSHSTLS